MNDNGSYMKLKTKYVIAGNVHQYEQFRRENKCKGIRYVYVCSPLTVMDLKLSKDDIIYYGTFCFRDDLFEIERVINERTH